MQTSDFSWQLSSHQRFHPHSFANRTNLCSSLPQVSKLPWCVLTRLFCPQHDVTEHQLKEADCISFSVGSTLLFWKDWDTFQSDGPKFINSTKQTKDALSTWLMNTLTPLELETTLISIKFHGMPLERFWLKTYTEVKLTMSTTVKFSFLSLKNSSLLNHLTLHIHFLMWKMKKSSLWKCLKVSDTVNSFRGFKDYLIHNRQLGVDFLWMLKKFWSLSKLEEQSTNCTNFKMSTRSRLH